METFNRKTRKSLETENEMERYCEKKHEDTKPKTSLEGEMRVLNQSEEDRV
jgi:hypothetical protein